MGRQTRARSLPFQVDFSHLYYSYLVLIVFMFDYLIHGWVVSGIVGLGILILTELLPLSSELDLYNIFQFDV